MSTTVIPFDFEGSSIRGISISDEPWFVAKDIASALGYSDTAKAVKTHCKAYRAVGVGVSPTLDPQTTIIPERDLYRLVMRSKLPAAERFENWVVGTVLPTIRKTGRYEATPSAPTDGAPMVDVNRLLLEHVELQRRLLEEQTLKSWNRNAEQHRATARCLIETTTLTDEEIAERMKPFIGRYMPEWVAWVRREAKPH